MRQTKRRVGQQLLLHGGGGLAARLYRARFESVAGSPDRASNPPTLVALNPGRFRGELEILARNGFRVLRAPYELQSRLLGLFFNDNDDVLAAAQDPVLAARRSHLRTALQSVLTSLYADLGADATISAALHYKQDLDWGAVSDQLGYPFIVLHRENLAASQAIIEHYSERARHIDRFAGSLIAFHNDTMRKIFVDAGYAPTERTAVTGAMRMDDLIVRLPSGPPARRQVTLFSFGPGAGILHSGPPHWPRRREEYLWKLCAETHVAVLEFARDHPDISVVVKPKWGGAWVDNLYELYRDRGLDAAAVANFSIVPDADAQDLIDASQVVIGFASTTLLEAAIMDRPVIVPWFAEATEPKWQMHLMFRDARTIFDCAASPAQLKALIETRLDDPAIDAAMRERRRRVFEAYVAPLDGSATTRTVDAIGRIVDAARSRRHLAARRPSDGTRKAA